MQQHGLYDYNGRKLLDAQYKLITVAADGQVRSYSDAVGAQAVVHDVRVCRPASVTTGQVVAAATAQTGGAQVRTQQTIGHAADKGSSLSGSSGGFGGGMQRADDGVLSDADKALQKQAEFNRETDELMRQMDEQIAWARILGDTEELIQKNKLIPAARHLNSSLKNFSSQDADLLKDIAEYVDDIKKRVNKYSWSVAGNGNMYNAANVLAELTGLANLEMELNALQVQFAIRSSQLGNAGAQRMLDIWSAQPADASPSYGGQAGGGYQGGGYQNGSGNETRKKQLLDNIAKYEQRIAEVERQKGTGIATGMMGDQTIANYRRMIQEAKAELRSMGYLIY